MADIKLSNIKKSFEQTEVLKGINLYIEDGEFITLVGASGSGKSTLLRIISGLAEQTSGSIQMNGQEISSKRPKDRNLAMVFQSYALYPHLSVFENMQVPLKMRLPKWQRLPMMEHVCAKSKAVLMKIEQRVVEVATLLHIEHLLARKPSELSGGQCQRVALGRAMVREPAAFLMDEPLSNLDAQLRVHMRGELTQLHRKLGTTFVYVTHDQVEAMTMSDRIALLVEGELIQVDTPHNMYTNPNHIKVAEFIGSPKINLIPATIDSENNISFADQLLDNIGIDAKQCGDKITMGVRSEDVRLLKSGGLAATVTHIENMGGEKIIFAAAEWAKGKVAIKLTSDEASGLEQGDNIGLAIKLQNVMFFDHIGARIQSQSLIQKR